MELGRSPFNVTIKWREIGTAAIGWAYYRIMPNPDGYHSDHFRHAEKLAEAEETDEDVIGFTYDEYGHAQPLHHTRDNFVMNRSEAELGWDDCGDYHDRENL